MTSNIDPPEPFAPKAEWQAHLEELRRLAESTSSPDLQSAIAAAQAILDGSAEAELTPLPDPKAEARKIV